MKSLSLITSESFGTITCDFYKNQHDELFMTREQIGQALGYGDPIRAISKLHERNQERLDPNSTVVKLTTTDKKQREVYLYTPKGIYEICRWSRQPKANQFFDWVYDIIESIRKHGIYTVDSLLDDPQMLSQAINQLKEERRIRKLAEIELLQTTKQLEEQLPLVHFAEACLQSRDSIMVRETAKLLSGYGFRIGEKGLFKKLRDWNLILKNQTEPSQQAIQANILTFEQKPCYSNNGIQMYHTTKITPKGQVYILNKLNRESKNKLN